ncbi:MAG TPA: bifunctional [glutamine synthetase] adenylyltransferase/[glutamine synthetase]-adenylyl-L-tyrosine phosphorylase [Microbacteriaceae bacterium]|nr:bifunctional [glutamine synthetase] adenylyltransferase/[glutamine synthetase]-adenylyl-L-tyrosine phosphorylase [Microbacteriaceae bacterium]
MRRSLGLQALAAVGFAGLSTAGSRLEALADRLEVAADDLLPFFRVAADPDSALVWLLRLEERAPRLIRRIVGDEASAARLFRLVGASDGLAQFLFRHPDECALVEVMPQLSSPAVPGEVERVRRRLLDAVGADAHGVASLAGETGWSALRVAYRRELVTVALYDLGQPGPVRGVDSVGRALAELAGAALEASLALARADVAGEGPGRFPADEVAATRLTVIGMGKAGAGELNYVSDVDVVFACASARPHAVPTARVVTIATRLARQTIRGLSEVSDEPALWPVDTNLRPEGKDGALVRTVESHAAYYRRWAKDWEFQALVKARPLAGDRALGRRYVDAVLPLVWRGAERDGFVSRVQEMRRRVIRNIPPDERDRQIKLGEGGLRDIEFTVQLLQLVHGRSDPHLRQADTLSALAALTARGYVGRAEARALAADYRTLRLLEHRLQLRHLARTHLMPSDEDGLRILARSSGLAQGPEGLAAIWSEVRSRVRDLHERLFYRPLLAAAAATPPEDFNLDSEQVAVRLQAIGFRNTRAALAHIAALSRGVTRRATIQRNLLPVLLQWLGEGADPDGGLLAFRRLSESLGRTHWFLGMLRDSSGAAQNLTRVLSSAPFVADMFQRIPSAVGWLDDEASLVPRPRQALDDQVGAILRRYDDPEMVAAALRTLRRQERLRLALNAIIRTPDVARLGVGLADVDEAVISGALATAMRVAGGPGLEFGVVAMGRLGGREVGFGSDADVLYVYRGAGEGDDSAPTASRVATTLVGLCADPVIPFDLDAGLRPEGRSGPLARSVEAYRAYYTRWSATWEAQALLRARPIAGPADLLTEFVAMADQVRYPGGFTEESARDVKRVKARVEAERLPHGADPRRHIKLGRGSLSDVEWLVQLRQLEHAADVPALRTTSTLAALSACVAAGLIEESDAGVLRDSWLLCSRLRSALVLWGADADTLPADRERLEPVARLMGYGSHAASVLEEAYLQATRRARGVFERLFYGPEPPSAE